MSLTGAHLIRNHSKRIYITIFRWLSVRESEGRGIQQFRRYVLDVAFKGGEGCVIRHFSIQHPDSTVISKAGSEIAVDENVRLDRNVSGKYKSRKTRIRV